VTFSNPKGVIANSDLHLVASISQHDVLVQMVDIREVTIHNSWDNIARVWWQHKGVTSNSGPTARLLRLQALHQRHYRYVPTFDYIAGEATVVEDACSRL
jgi:hypothetical protein